MLTLESPYNKFVVVVGIFLALFQGVIWCIFSLIAIIWHLAASYDMLITYEDSYSNLLQAYMYYTFVKNNGPRTTLYVQPDGFFGAMIFYFLLNVAWVATSIYAYAGLKKSFSCNRMLASLTVWIAAASSNLILDLVFCAFLGADYEHVVHEYDKSSDILMKLAYTYSTIAYGIVMVLAARGFVLWIINLVLTGLFIQVCLDLKKNCPNETPSQNDVFSTNPRMRAFAGNLPEEARNYAIDEVPVRRQTLPAPSSQNDILSTSSTFAPVNRSMLYVYDPEVERRLNMYKMTPNRLKNRFN